MASFFYKDEYDEDNYAISMYETNPKNDQYFRLASPEAFTINAKTGAVTAPKFVGALEGNASTATKATQDASGNVITETYATKSELAASALVWGSF